MEVQGCKITFTFFLSSLCSFCIHTEYVVYISYGFFQVYTSEKQLMRVTGFHPLDDPNFKSIAENVDLNLSDVRSLIHAPTYLTSQIPPYLNQLVSTFSNVPHPQRQQVQNQNFLNTGLHGTMLGWDNNQQKKY